MESLNHFDVESFLRDYWQQRPLLIRGAVDPDRFVLSPEELAGLACEESIESRLIRGAGMTDYSLQHGPFDDTVFNTLPDSDWTVLVQAVDHIVPEVAALLDYFRFIPNWRIDDVMVSYATPGGSAGPHYDNYDVFLIQGSGSRLWKVGDHVGDNPELLQHSDLRLLKHFQSVEEWELHPGDILYLPPRCAHWGISSSADCMTYSVGFRGPGAAELLSEFCDRAIVAIPDHRRYRDSDLYGQANPGEISTAAIEQVRQLVLEPLSDPERLARWFGQYMTQPKYEPPAEIEDDNGAPITSEEFEQALASEDFIYRDPASRFAYIDTDSGLYLFINGREYPLERDQLDFAQHLCAAAALPCNELSGYLRAPSLASLLLALYSQGNLYFGDELYDQDS